MRGQLGTWTACIVTMSVLQGCGNHKSEWCPTLNYVYVEQGSTPFTFGEGSEEVTDTPPTLGITLIRSDVATEVAEEFALDGSLSEGFSLISGSVIASDGPCLDEYLVEIQYTLSPPEDWSIDTSTAFPEIIEYETFSWDETMDGTMTTHTLWNDWTVDIRANVMGAMS